jgi:hypothetical protein
MLTSMLTTAAPAPSPGLSVVMNVSPDPLDSIAFTRSPNPARAIHCTRSRTGQSNTGASKYQARNITGNHASAASTKRVRGLFRKCRGGVCS